MRESKPRPGYPSPPRRPPAPAALLALLLLLAHPAFATIDTLEWMTSDADVIVRGTVGDGHLLKGAKLPTDVVNARITETLKGPPGDSLTFLADAVRFRPWDDGEFLFFLKTAGHYGDDQHSPEKPAAAADPCGWVCVNRVPLEADGGVGAVYDGALRRLEKAGDILDVVRREVAHPRARQPGSVEVQVGVFPGTPLSPGMPGELLGQTVRWLLNARTEAFAQKLTESAQPQDREMGVWILKHFKSAENIRRMTALLNDPYVLPNGTPLGCIVVEYGYGKWAAGPYPIRRAADYALSEWRAAPAETVPLYQPKYAPRYLPRWGCAALASGALLLPLLLACGTIFVTRRFTRGVWAASAVLLLLSTAACLRSAWRIDELAFTAGKDRYELVARAGGIRIMRLEDVRDVFPAAFTTVPRTPTTDTDWEPETAGALRWRDTRLGVERMRGTVWYGGQTYVLFTGFVFPWWMLCAASAVPPALASAGAAILRRRKARKTPGRCHQCGYDLRASPAGCPECGWGR
jgi:hypothetical protein